MGLKSMFQNSWFGEKELNTPKDVSKWLDKYEVKNYTINDDLTVDVLGDVDISENNLKKIPVQFGKVNGYFNCSGNQLISLKGCPKEIGEYFHCSFNELTSLEYSPKEVGTFDCSYNELTSLKHAPIVVLGDFNCSENHLKSIEHAPKEVLGNFDCSHNQLVSLKGCPKEIEVYFDCSFNKLTTLEHAPKQVAHFDCSNNQLTSLEHAPNVVGDILDKGEIEFSNNKFKDDDEELQKYEGLLHQKEEEDYQLSFENKIEQHERLLIGVPNEVVSDKQKQFDQKVKEMGLQLESNLNRSAKHRSKMKM